MLEKKNIPSEYIAASKAAGSKTSGSPRASKAQCCPTQPHCLAHFICQPRLEPRPLDAASTDPCPLPKVPAHPSPTQSPAPVTFLLLHQPSSHEPQGLSICRSVVVSPLVVTAGSQNYVQYSHCEYVCCEHLHCKHFHPKHFCLTTNWPKEPLDSLVYIQQTIY